MKKGLLFGLMVVLLAGFGFGGVSLAGAVDCMTGDNDSQTQNPNAVAQINETCYDSFSGAVDARTGNDTVIKLLVSGETYHMRVDQVLKINRNSKSITLKAPDNYFADYISSNGIFTYTVKEAGIKRINANGETVYLEPKASDLNLGGTYILLKDLSLEKRVPKPGVDVANSYPQNYTIDLNGYNITSTSSDFGFIFKRNGTENFPVNVKFINSNTNSGGVITLNDNIQSAIQILGKKTNIEIGEGVVINGGPIYLSGEDQTLIVRGIISGGEKSAILITSGAKNSKIYIEEGAVISSNVVAISLPDELAEGQNIKAITNTITLTDGYVWIVDGDGYKVIKAENVVKVIFKDGENTVYETDIEKNTTITPPAYYGKKGYIFQGWFNGDDKFDFETPVTSNLTLRAKWEALSDLTGTVEDEDFTGVVLVPEEPALIASDETTIETAIASSNSIATMEGVVEVMVYTDNDEDGQVGIGDIELTGKVNFTTARLVRIPVTTTGNVVIKVRHTGQSGFSYEGLSTSSGAACNAGNANPSYNGELITPTSGYVEIYTCSASTFVAYTEIANPTHSSSTSGGGGGGGSSSSYSCKSLPANAVANNTSKPKKDTNYSYSTDTGAVCTFQCKAGYTRNEKNEKCEKSSETLTDTDKEGTEKVDTTDTSDTAFEDLRKVLDDGYNVEFHNAYNFAFKNGITTMPNIQAADMNSPLTRIAMAKMLSKYAINVLKKTPDTTKTISFPDVSAELDAEYNNGVTLAYQLGIMGVNIENFRPDDLVTRAEFVTALSRMLFGLADGENLYYETHMQKLLDENIITVDNPNMHELRGYVMIMLMRSVKNN